MGKSGSTHDPADHLGEDRIIDRGRTFGCPDESFKTITGIDNPEFHRVVHLPHSVHTLLLTFFPCRDS